MFAMNFIGILFFTILVTKSCISLTAASSVFVQPVHALEQRVSGGQAAAPHRYPYMVSLQLRFLWVRAHFCGGSLLNRNWILTAGHCVTESWLIRWLNIDAVAGAHDVDSFSTDVQIRTIVQRIEHHNYMGGIGPNDIAVLKADQPFIFTKEIRPIRLPSENVDLSKGSLLLAGWGALNTTRFIPELPSLLQELKVTYVPFEECYKQLTMFLENDADTNPLDLESNICTGPLDGGKAACVGDSGGPLIINYSKAGLGDTVDADNDFLVGVVSWGVSPCGEEGAPTVYTNVSNYLDFIKSYVNS